MLGAPLWLSWLSSELASILPKETSLTRRQPEGSFVYRGDARCPRDIRNAGGFRPQGDGWEHDESAFNLERHYRAGPNGCGLESDETGDDFVFRTAYVSVAQSRWTAEDYGTWLYEIRATPNILDDDFAQTEVMALGGIHWRQIRRYTRMRNDVDERVDESSWFNNPEYDAETYEPGPLAAECHVSDDIPGILRNGQPDSDS